MVHYYVVVRFLFLLHLSIFIAHLHHTLIMTKNTNNLSTDVTMESLIAEVRTLKAELSTLQAGDSLHNLSLDEPGRERQSHSGSRPHKTKIQYFANLPGENFLAWRSQFQVIASYHRWSDDEAKQLVYAYMKGIALESVMDIRLTGPETIGQVLDAYQDRFLPECDSQLLRTQFACVVQMPNESVQKLHARMRVLYHLAYPDASTGNEVYLIEKFISALNNREVQNHVRRRKPTTYAKALSIANEETSFVLMDIATHAPGGLQAPVPGDNSFITASQQPSGPNVLIRADTQRLRESATTAMKQATSKNDVLCDSRTSSNSDLINGTRELAARLLQLADLLVLFLPLSRSKLSLLKPSRLCLW